MVPGLALNDALALPGHVVHCWPLRSTALSHLVRSRGSVGGPGCQRPSRTNAVTFCSLLCPFRVPETSRVRQCDPMLGKMSSPSQGALRSNWGYEEIVLAADLVVANSWVALDRRSDPRVAELSLLLRRMSPERAAADPTFRNADGVGRKTHDLATARRAHTGARTKGGQLTTAVAHAFEDDPDAMHRLALGIRAVALDADSLATAPLDVDEDVTFDEGRVFERRHLARERDPRARRAKIAHARLAFGHIRCEVCQFDFETVYGEHGRDYVECHHRDPLSVSGRRTTTVADLALLCSNCHRMIHYRRPWLTVEQLRSLVGHRSRLT